MESNFMQRFWQFVDDRVSESNKEHLGVFEHLDTYIFTHRDGHIFVQAYNEYHLFQLLHEENKLQMVIADGDIFEIIQDVFQDYETDDMNEIVNYMLLNCGYWSDFNYKKIKFLVNYERF